MYVETDTPLRELARNEPLLERARLMTDSPGPSAPNGIRLVRVAVDNAADTATLDVHFYNTNYLSSIVTKYNGDKKLAKTIFPITGGSRLRAGGALGQVQVDSSTTPLSLAITKPEPTIIRLVVRPIGDYSTYTLGISSIPLPPATKIDPLFSEIRFKFRPGCFNNNCAPEWEAALPPFDEPVIDYLAKDYESFRSTMITAMSQRVPEWEPTSEADLDMVIAELFSVAADELSDYQDRVLNEAYLASARKRVSLARHARMMDYHIHQGSQASTWLALEIGHEVGQKSFQLKQGLRVWAGDTETPETNVEFLSKHTASQSVHQYLNSIGLYTWSDTITSLKAGSTRADLKLFERLYPYDTVAPFPVTTQAAAVEIRDLIRTGRIPRLLIQEHLNPKTGFRAGRNRLKRQLVHLIPEQAEALHDPITNEWFVRVRWEKRDALRFDYCFTVDCPDSQPGLGQGQIDFVSLFHGNLVEIFHGREQTTIFRDEGTELVLNPNQLEFHYRRRHFGDPARWGVICELPEIALAYQHTTPGGDKPPVSTLKVTIDVPGAGVEEWDEVPSFIHSDDSSENGDHFVVETDEKRRSIVRFGNGRNGRELPDYAVVSCTYQHGLPLDGNVGADRIVNFDLTTVAADPAAPAIKIRRCWNPFDASNGIEREPVAEIIRRVPEAYRYRQLRAVTLADYVARAEKIDGVSRAAARYAWTGSWRTVRVTIDPVGTNEVSYELRKTVSDYLNAVRLIGEDLEIRPPMFVPLEIKVILCAVSDVWAEDIRFVLEQEFSAGWTPDGRKGFFHPDEWTFGQPLYASQIIGRAIRVKGIQHAVGQKITAGGTEKTISVSIKRRNTPGIPTDSLTQLNYNEIIQVMNDPDHLEQGTITFDVKGGRQ